MSFLCKNILTVRNFNNIRRLDYLIKPAKLAEQTRCLSLVGMNLQKASSPLPDDESDPPNPFYHDSSKIKKYLEQEKKFNGKLVYVGGLTSRLLTAKFISLSSSALGIMMLPFLTDTLSSSSIFAKLFVFGTTGFFIFVTPLFAQFLTRRYVSRLYYNYEEKKFKAVMISFLMYEYKFEFSLDDVYVPDVPGPFTTIALKSSKRGLFVQVNDIIDDNLVQKIYGYDKPFDIKKYTDKN